MYHTYITGNTFGKTTAPSAKYWYNILVSVSSVLYFTSVARTVNTSACVWKSINTSGSSRILFSLLTDTLAPRLCKFTHQLILKNTCLPRPLHTWCDCGGCLCCLAWATAVWSNRSQDFCLRFTPLLPAEIEAELVLAAAAFCCWLLAVVIFSAK